MDHWAKLRALAAEAHTVEDICPLVSHKLCHPPPRVSSSHTHNVNNYTKNKQGYKSRGCTMLPASTPSLP